MIYPTIRPVKVSGDPVVSDIRVLIYSPEGNVKYKPNFYYHKGQRKLAS